jgi:hypothetical protein
MAKLDRIPRTEKKRITHLIQANLVARQAAGPADPALDEFIPLVAASAAALDEQVEGKQAAEGDRQVELAHQDECDDEVDTLLRLLEALFHAESHRRHGPNVATALALYQAAFPDGLEHIDDRIVVENAHCRATLTILSAPEHAAALAALKLPADWLPRFGQALDASDAATVAVDAARLSKGSAVAGGKNAELQWTLLMKRLSSHLNGRADQGASAKTLLAPLIAANALLNAQTSARKTRKAAAATPAAAQVTPPERKP